MGREESQITGRGEGKNRMTGKRRLAGMGAGRKYGSGSKEDRQRWGGVSGMGRAGEEGAGGMAARRS